MCDQSTEYSLPFRYLCAVFTFYWLFHLFMFIAYKRIVRYSSALRNIGLLISKLLYNIAENVIQIGQVRGSHPFNLHTKQPAMSAYSL